MYQAKYGINNDICRTARAHEFKLPSYNRKRADARAAAKRSDAMHCYALCSKMSGETSWPAIRKWLKSLHSQVELSERKARRFQAELLLCIGEKGESI